MKGNSRMVDGMDKKLSRRQFLTRAFAVTVGAALAGVGGVGYARNVEPDWVDVERVRLKLPSLSQAFNGYRVVQISDIHMDGWMTHERMVEITALINSLHPDLIALTGDFITRRANRVADVLKGTLGSLQAKDEVVAVLGNHDQKDEANVRDVLRKSGVIELSNTVHTIRRGGEQFHIAGVDDVWYELDRMDEVLSRLPKRGAAMLLAHEPDYADTSAATGRFDLQVSGHSHGGQVVVPMLGPQRLPPLARKYPSGLYRVGSMLQYTNRGVGMAKPYVRFNCRPEVTLFTLESGQS